MDLLKKTNAFSFTYNNSAMLTDVKHSENGGSDHKASFKPATLPGQKMRP